MVDLENFGKNGRGKWNRAWRRFVDQRFNNEGKDFTWNYARKQVTVKVTRSYLDLYKVSLIRTETDWVESVVTVSITKIFIFRLVQEKEVKVKKNHRGTKD